MSQNRCQRLAAKELKRKILYENRMEYARKHHTACNLYYTDFDCEDESDYEIISNARKHKGEGIEYDDDDVRSDSIYVPSKSRTISENSTSASTSASSSDSLLSLNKSKDSSVVPSSDTSDSIQKLPNNSTERALEDDKVHKYKWNEIMELGKRGIIYINIYINILNTLNTVKIIYIYIYIYIYITWMLLMIMVCICLTLIFIYIYIYLYQCIDKLYIHLFIYIYIYIYSKYRSS